MALPPSFFFKIFKMAVSVDTVYKTVLYILNKEQRGYITPDEFNNLATQVQLEIFESYFESLNQQLRVGNNSSEYADRVKKLEEKTSRFFTSEALTVGLETDRVSRDASSGAVVLVCVAVVLGDVAVSVLSEASSGLTVTVCAAVAVTLIRTWFDCVLHRSTSVAVTVLA